VKPAVAYLGPEKTHTYFAALATFGPRYEYLHEPTVEDVFSSVERQRAVYGIVPVENSLEGAVTHTLDRFVEFWRSPVEIYGEIDQPIEHYLITRPGTRRQAVRIVYSHPQALGQCRRWLQEQILGVLFFETSSTAEAVTRLLSRDRLWKPAEQAAIARRELARPHGLKATPIPLTHENRTRFLIVGLPGISSCRPGRRYKTSVLFSLKDRAGALHDALVPFKTYRINLTKIESRPSKRQAWEYYFFVDLEGERRSRPVAQALAQLTRRCSEVRVLGSYPVAAR